MHELIPQMLIALALLIGMLLSLELGRWIGRRRARRDSEGLGIGAVDSAIFGVFALLVAFTFSGASERFDQRRHMIVQEANAIGTAWLRLDLLPPEAQPGLRDLFRKYLDSRVETYRKIPDMIAVHAEFERSTKLQQEIWTQATAACNARKDPSNTSLLVLPALNDVFDIMTKRITAGKLHPPWIIHALLFVLALGCSLLAGHGMAQFKARSWVHIIGFASVMALSIYVILDLEYPRTGIISVEDFDVVLTQLRQSMK